MTDDARERAERIVNDQCVGISARAAGRKIGEFDLLMLTDAIAAALPPTDPEREAMAKRLEDVAKVDGVWTSSMGQLLRAAAAMLRRGGTMANLDETIATIVEGIWRDVNDRSGIDLGQYDQKVQIDIRESWTKIVRDAAREGKA